MKTRTKHPKAIGRRKRALAEKSAPKPAEKSVPKPSRKAIAIRNRLLRQSREALDRRLNARREQWDREDRELRTAMAAVGGGDWTNMMQRLGMRPLRPVSSLAGKTMAARFDSAITTDDNVAHWSMADGLAADAAANPMIRYTLRNRSRYEFANNSYCMGVGHTIANDFVGTGPRLHIDDPRLSDEERAEVERKFSAWSAEIRLANKLRLMRLAKRNDGEAFACKITNPRLNHPIKLDMRVIEADQVRFVDISLLLSPSVDGIRFDDYGNPVSYHVLRIHPGYWSYATGYVGMPWEYDVWDAKLVIHWFRQDRPGQHRGLPEILPALPLYATLRRYTQATLDAAETAADFAVLLETEAGAQFVDATGAIIDNAAELAEPFTTQDMQRRMLMTLPAGYKASQMRPEHPQQQYAPFKREICAEIGRCECVPANVVMADSSGSNFSSGQLDHKIYFRTREIERSEASQLILDNLLSDWIADGVRTREGEGDFGKPYLPQILRELGIGLSHQWYWDSNELGDPLKLAAARATDLKSGVTTIPGIYARKGQNWKTAFIRQAEALGCTVDELKALVRTSIFASAPEPSVEDDEDKSDKSEADEKPTPAIKRPQKAAMQKAVTV